MKTQMTFDQFTTEVNAAGFQVRECGDGHWQILGPRLVNFYPHGKKGATIYPDKAPKSIRGRGATVKAAIDIARQGLNGKTKKSDKPEPAPFGPQESRVKAFVRRVYQWTGKVLGVE